jgi:hypothetical protein
MKTPEESGGLSFLLVRLGIEARVLDVSLNSRSQIALAATFFRPIREWSRRSKHRRSRRSDPETVRRSSIRTSPKSNICRGSGAYPQLARSIQLRMTCSLGSQRRDAPRMVTVAIRKSNVRPDRRLTALKGC